jgi:hypothetical protein
MSRYVRGSRSPRIDVPSSCTILPTGRTGRRPRPRQRMPPALREAATRRPSGAATQHCRKERRPRSWRYAQRGFMLRLDRDIPSTSRLNEINVNEPTKEELERASPRTLDSDSLKFVGLRGDQRRHLDRAALEAGIASARAPLDEGSVDLLVARGKHGERYLTSEARLTVCEGMPGDRWAAQDKYGPDFQLATTRSDFARLIANGQPLELHGDNLYLHLDLSRINLPARSLIRAGEALLEVTPAAHDGCKKWVQRFGLCPMQLNLDPGYRAVRLRGIYLRVVEEGRVRVGDRAVVVVRGISP